MPENENFDEFTEDMVIYKEDPPIERQAQPFLLPALFLY